MSGKITVQELLINTLGREVNVVDTRSVPDIPMQYPYQQQNLSLDFKDNSAIFDLPDMYSGVMTVAPWVDNSGGYPHQIAFHQDGHLYHRFGIQSPQYAWVANNLYSSGTLAQPTANNGHYYKVITTGQSGGTQPTWPTSSGATVTDSNPSGTTIWAASTAYALNAIVVPTTANGFYYVCTTAGTSGTTQPTWATTNSSTTTDNTVVWTAHQIAVWQEAGFFWNSFDRIITAGNGSFTASITSTAPPNTGNGIFATDGTRYIRIMPSYESGAYNPLVASGDSIIEFDSGSLTSASGLSIVPWNSSNGGIRLTSSGQVLTGRNTLDDGTGNTILNGTYLKQNGTDGGVGIFLNTPNVNNDQSIQIQAQGIPVMQIGYHNSGNSVSGASNAGNRFISVYDGTNWHETDIDQNGNWTMPSAFSLPNGSMSVGADIHAGLSLHCGGENASSSPYGQGAYIAWNYSGGTGETDFFNNKGTGVGGFWFYNGSASTWSTMAYLNSSGDWYASAYDSISDGRLKENIVTIDNPLSKVKSLRGVYYTWSDKYKTHYSIKEDSVKIGVVAQEVQQVLPEIVNEHTVFGTDDPHLSLDYSKIVPVLIEAIKELSDKVDSLESQLSMYKSSI